jgi:hypothetical protein
MPQSWDMGQIITLKTVRSVTNGSLCCDKIKPVIIQNDFVICGRKFIRFRLHTVPTFKSITDALFQSLTICFLYASFLMRLLYFFTTFPWHIFNKYPSQNCTGISYVLSCRIRKTTAFSVIWFNMGWTLK